MSLRAILLAIILVAPLAAVEAPRPVPREIVDLLTRCAAVEPDAAAALLEAWHGESHPLLLLARGQTRWRLAQTGADAEVRTAGAQADFRAALALDPTLRQAHLGLAQIAARREDWPTASQEAAAGLDPATVDRAELDFLAWVALRAGDWRLAALAAQRGILHFPADRDLRRVELAVLVNAGRGEEARQAALALLAQEPTDTDLWRHLAWSDQQTGRTDEALAALEAAQLGRPGDAGLRRQLASLQDAQGLTQAAYRTIRPLLGDQPSSQVLADSALMLFASRVAAASGALEEARSWLALVPTTALTRDLRLQKARLAVQAKDSAAAVTALDELIALGESSPAILVWAGALAEERGDAGRAEMWYRQAAAGEGSAAIAGSLRLAAGCLARGRLDEARTLLTALLAQHPDEVHARQLLDRLAASHLELRP